MGRGMDHLMVRGEDQDCRKGDQNIRNGIFCRKLKVTREWTRKGRRHNNASYITNRWLLGGGVAGTESQARSLINTASQSSRRIKETKILAGFSDFYLKSTGEAADQPH